MWPRGATVAMKPSPIAIEIDGEKWIPVVVVVQAILRESFSGSGGDLG